ncbi:hypothetical protein QTQ03_08475 [Micromonospora sp. WMMA1363]|uniref:hypothetical protein n=1 Tax=Micromonospora sp. WMMA1363 TaxID=3053985 RepID=UPI00259C8425|nr:hypothetical protein [Micromonospora sp. WMMA1363]MDM4719617.1 hypothetical protein [Micromonospora sp. WMMA1363]
MRFSRKSRAVLTIVALAGALVITGAGTAVAVATLKSGTSVTRTVISTENAATQHQNAAFVSIRTIRIYAPRGSHVLARFTAESACYGGSGWCSARILVDGVEADPVTGTDFAFDSTNSNQETNASWESHSMERARTVTFTGNHTITLQLAQVGAGVRHRIDDWALSGWAIAA